MRTNRKIRPWLLLAASAAMFLPFLTVRDIVTSHEARVVQVARQMAQAGWPWNARLIEATVSKPNRITKTELTESSRAGRTIAVNPWIVPVMDGQIRLQKPPLPYWCAAVIYRIFGYAPAWSRIVPALLGMFSTLLVWDLVKTFLGRSGAWLASMVWLSSYFVVDEFRKAMADPYLAFFTLLATWAWFRRRPTVFWIALGLGALAKGPIIFVFVVVLAAAGALLSPRGKFPRQMSREILAHTIGAMIFAAIVLPWPLTVVRAVPDAVELWRYESIGALSDKTENARPWWFYLPNLLQITLPWTPLWLMGLVFPFLHRKPRRFWAMSASLVILLIFSLAYPKKNAYLLPIMPLQVMLAAQGLLWAGLIPPRRSAPVLLKRFTAAAAAVCVAVNVFLNVFLARAENRRSPRQVCELVIQMLDQSPRRSLLVSHLPVEAAVYLPLGLCDSADSDEVLVIADDRRGQAAAVVGMIGMIPAGQIVAAEQVPIPQAPGPRWKLFKLRVSPVQRTTPG